MELICASQDFQKAEIALAAFKLNEKNRMISC